MTRTCVLRTVPLVRVEQPHHAVDLVEQFLEPELVPLMNNDEQQLVVLGAGRARPPQRDQFFDVEVVAVGSRRRSPPRSCCQACV